MERAKSLTLLKALVAAYALTGVLLIALAFLLYRFHLSESFTNMAVNAVYILACLTGGMAAGKALGHRKFLWGLLTGILYFAVLLAASAAMGSAAGISLSEVLTVFAMCAFSGTAGGMLG